MLKKEGENAIWTCYLQTNFYRQINLPEKGDPNIFKVMDLSRILDRTMLNQIYRHVSVYTDTISMQAQKI